MVVFRIFHTNKYHHVLFTEGIIMNSYKDYIEFKKKKEAFQQQCFLITLCGFLLISTIIMSLLSFPLYMIIGTLKTSFIVFIILLVAVIHNGCFISYREYRRRKKAMFVYLDKIIENDGDLDDEILLLLKKYKKFK